MDEKYDVIVLGTGWTECMLSGILSVEGKKVLQIDRNDYFGGECVRLNLEQLYTKFRDGEQPPASLGSSRDYHIDLITKFMMADEGLMKVLEYTGVMRYLKFKQIASSLVCNYGKTTRVPTNGDEAAECPLVVPLSRRGVKNFFDFMQSYDDPRTRQGLNLDRDTMKTVFNHFSLEGRTEDLIGHAIALYFEDSYRVRPARPTYNRIMTYMNSIPPSGQSPYICPDYGLSELSEGFARLSAANSSTTMLAQPVDEIVRDSEGKFVGVRSGDKVARAKLVIGDPSYFHDSVRKTGRVIRAICILQHPITNAEGDGSAQIIVSRNQTFRKHDIYVAILSAAQHVCAEGYWLASVSTIAETQDDPKEEIGPGLGLLGKVEHLFVSVSDLYEPVEDGVKDSVFISRSYDATSHFRTVYDDILSVYKRITGNDLQLEKRRTAEEEQATMTT